MNKELENRNYDERIQYTYFELPEKRLWYAIGTFNKHPFIMNHAVVDDFINDVCDHIIDDKIPLIEMDLSIESDSE